MDALIIGPNLALDHWCELGALPRPGEVVRATAEHISLGGKGANVSRALNRLGVSSRVVGFVGGHVGYLLLELAKAEGMAIDPCPVDGENRIASLLAPRESPVCVINPPGPAIVDSDWLAFNELVRQLIRTAEPKIIICSGSTPPGAPIGAYADIIAFAGECGVPSLLDASGPTLQAALSAKPDWVKINSAEALDVVAEEAGRRGDALERVRLHASLARALRKRGAITVVITDGSGPTVAVTDDEVHVAQAPQAAVVNTAGGGDAFLAGFVSRWLRNGDFVDQLRWGIAAGSASVQTQQPGDFEISTAAAIARATAVKHLESQ